MRRVVWSVLTGLGVFFIVVAIMARFFIPGQAIKFPLNEFSKSTVQAEQRELLQPEVRERGVRGHPAGHEHPEGRRRRGQVDRPQFQVRRLAELHRDRGHHPPPAGVASRPQADTLAFDRKTGVLVPWSGNPVGGKPVNVSGQGPLFPLGTKKQSYQVFDTTLLKPVTFHYAGTATTGGIGTYVFAATVPSHAGRHPATAGLAGRHDRGRSDAAGVLQRQVHLLRRPADRRAACGRAERPAGAARTALAPPGWCCCPRTSSPPPPASPPPSRPTTTAATRSTCSPSSSRSSPGCSGSSCVILGVVLEPAEAGG